MSEHHRHDDADGAKVERAVGATVMRSLNLLVTLICAAGMFWVQATMVSKSELRLFETKFETLRDEMTRTRMDMLSMPRWDKRLDEIESRLKDLEKAETRRFPPQRRTE